MAFFEHATHEFLHYLTMRTPIVLSSNFVLSHIKKEDVSYWFEFPTNEDMWTVWLNVSKRADPKWSHEKSKALRSKCKIVSYCCKTPDLSRWLGEILCRLAFILYLSMHWVTKRESDRAFSWFLAKLVGLVS